MKCISSLLFESDVKCQHQWTNNDGMFDYTNEYFKNGNVKRQTLSGAFNNNFTNTYDLTFDYTYDKSNRLLSSITPAKKFNLTNTYDKDGNILTLRRYGSSENLIDSFNYSYYSGTNKVSKVKGGSNQYTYDLNGSITKDDLNENSNIKYDYRNLIIELRQKSGAKYYNTFYKYDESGNRISKTTYEYQGSTISEDTIATESDFPNSNDWVLYNKEIYSRDVSGRVMAIYRDDQIEEYSVYGLDLIG